MYRWARSVASVPGHLFRVLRDPFAAHDWTAFLLSALGPLVLGYAPGVAVAESGNPLAWDRAVQFGAVAITVAVLSILAIVRLDYRVRGIDDPVSRSIALLRVKRASANVSLSELFITVGRDWLTWVRGGTVADALSLLDGEAMRQEAFDALNELVLMGLVEHEFVNPNPSLGRHRAFIDPMPYDQWKTTEEGRRVLRTLLDVGALG